MGYFSPQDVANVALDHLKENKYTDDQRYGLNTGQLHRAVVNKDRDKYQNLDHAEFRAIMNRLHSAGVVKRSGTGKFVWQIRKEALDWNRTWPFKKLPTAPGNEPPAYTNPKTHTHDHHGHPNFQENFEDEKPQSQPPPDLSHVHDLLGKLALKLAEHEAVLQGIAPVLATIMAEVQGLKDRKDSHVKVLKVELPNGKTVKLKDVVLPRVFDRVFSLARCRRNIMLFGPAGCGKTYLAKLVADSLGLDFGSVSCTAGMSESHLLGRTVPDLTKGENVFQGAAFLDCYEKGGVYLFDELDAADPNLLLCVNTALANGYCNVPNRRKKPRADRHEDFVCVGTANTVGRGATRMYQGRNQLDEATLDRFRIGMVECDYDPSVELAVCPDIGGEEGRAWNPPLRQNGHDNTVGKLVSLGYNLRQTCQFVRHKIEQTGMRRIMSTRFLEDAYVMMSAGGWDLKTVLEAYFEGWTPEEKAKVT